MSEALTAGRRPPLSVVVPTSDRPELLTGALQALATSVAPTDEVIVVESGSHQPEPVWSVAEAAGARLLVAERPGVSLARNVGWREARHDLIAFLDDDIRVEPGWADAMATALAAHPGAAFVAGRIELPANQGTLALTVMAATEPMAFDRTSRGMLGHSANLGMHRTILEAVGGFDEVMGPGARFPAGEDPDLLDRCLATGATGFYEPAAGAAHEHWRRGREYVRLQHRYGVGAGARMAKLIRTDRRRFRLVATDDLWRWGVVSIVGELVRWDPIRATGSVLRLLGMVRGLVTALAVPVRSGHFRRRASSRS